MITIGVGIFLVLILFVIWSFAFLLEGEPELSKFGKERLERRKINEHRR